MDVTLLSRIQFATTGATWIPKVGGGRTEARRWSFDLRNSSGDWRIVRAEAR